MSRLNALIAAASRGVSLQRESKPFRIDPPAAKEAVLLLHGFTGEPRELYAPGKALSDAGFAVYAPRYPGHGTCSADFLATRADDWVRRALDSYIDLRADYPVVHILGHSMGGLIATILAEAFAVPRLILLAPAFRTSNPGMKWVPFLAPFFPVIRRGREEWQSEVDPTRKILRKEYDADDLIRPAAELRRLMMRARHSLPSVKSEVLVVHGDSDSVVPPEVPSYVVQRAKNAASVDVRMIAGAGHIFPFDASAAEGATVVRDWMSRPAR
jgi:carboxylesterase